MSPGAFRQVTPWLSARPERGSTNAAYPDGTAIAIPVATSARPPAWSMWALVAAYRSYPASSGCCAAGRSRSASSRRTLMCISLPCRRHRLRLLRAGRRAAVAAATEYALVAQVLEELLSLLVGELDDGVVVRVVDDDAGRAARERVDLLGREAELQVVDGRRRFLPGETLLVQRSARHRRAVVQPERHRPLDAHQLREPLVEALLVVDLEEQRPCQLVGAGGERVVGSE